MMNINKLDVEFYRLELLNVKQKVLKGKILPAKTILLLSVISGIENNIISKNIIAFDTIKAIYDSIFTLYSHEKFPPIDYPYYYIKNDGFWHIKWKENAIEKKTPSAKFIRENIEYAYLDNALWDLLQIEDVREEYKNTIINFYLK